MDFSIKRNDEADFRNFTVKVSGKYLIDRNEDFYSEIREWVDGVSDLMRKGQSYFSADRGFAPFVATLSGERVQFETTAGESYSCTFFEVVANTIAFLYEQCSDDTYSERDIVFFRKNADSLLAGSRFHFKEKFRPFVTYLVEKRLLREEVVVL